ncbi:glycosyltransferase family 2 protein [Geobacter pelophilus]|uniref:dolichyl-phosphate beta-glucosyltransferase n=1 Tax=Geoanaerobacter pelophilus TaxID=60036 RepID=A0AAW4L639_9BACT|nr:dolichyl-phosphate beta-glucosyltransferase [Geoanaerobacter pelophilus]MBT0664493.1 glycosyltransferase family 2 protein [Geoanaerobacter pelophilus]
MENHFPAISITIPAYNEESRLPGYLNSILAYISQNNISYEIIVVDDGSTDSTSAIVKSYSENNPNIKLIRLSHNCGKGYAVKTGMLLAKGKLRLFADADGATPINELDRLKKYIDSGAAVVIASRALKDNSCTIRAHLHRKIIGSIFNFIARLLTVKGIHDTQCGFKLFTEEAAKTIFPLQQINGFGFDVELLFISQIKGYKIEEVSVNWTDIPITKVKLFRDSWLMFTDVLKVRLNYLRGFYGSI